MKIKGGLFYVVVIALLWCAVNASKPYWDKYWLGIDIESASIYGTKNSISATRDFLAKKMRENGYSFKGDDFYIEKNQWNDVTVSITYDDEISVFGVCLKPLEITVEKISSNVT